MKLYLYFFSFLYLLTFNTVQAINLVLEQGQLLMTAKILNTSDNGRYIGDFYLSWHEVRRANTSGGDFVISGYFYADSDTVSWGNNANPEVYAKIWFAKDGILNLNFFHVGLFDININSRFNNTKPKIIGKKTIRINDASERYLRHDYDWKTSLNQNNNSPEFNYSYPFVTGEFNILSRNSLIEAHFLETFADSFNKIFRLPTDVELVLDQCDTSNAFYNSNTKRITLCYELFADIFIYSDTAEEAMNIFIFVLFHELGHALIDVFNLPITGREEDVADQFSSIILLVSNSKTDGEIALVNAADFFWNTTSSSTSPDYWDEHSLNEQRFYNMLCWTYGKSPDRWQGIVDNGWLPASRAVRCKGEWQQMKSSWNTLLAPYLK